MLPRVERAFRTVDLRVGDEDGEVGEGVVDELVVGGDCGLWIIDIWSTFGFSSKNGLRVATGETRVL